MLVRTSVYRVEVLTGQMQCKALSNAVMTLQSLALLLFICINILEVRK